MGIPFEERVLWGAAVPASALAVGILLVVTAWLVPETYPPDAPLFLSSYAADCRPEPLEQLRYVLAIAVVPVVLWIAAVASRRRAANPVVASRSAPWWGRWASAVQWLICAFVVAAVVYQEIFIRATIDRWSFLATVLALGLLAVGWRFAPTRWTARSDATPAPPATALRRAARFVWAAAPWMAAVAACVGELAPGLLEKNRAFACHPAITAHYPVFMEEFAAPAYGRTVLVDYFPQYQNLLGYALAPAFRLTGLNAYTFSTAMVLLSLALLLFFFAAFRLATGGGWRALLLFLPFLWLSMAPMDCFRVGAFESRCNDFTYLAAAPLRYFGPGLTLAVLVWYFGRPGRFRMAAVFATAGVAAVNNLDFGVPALGAALIAVLFGTADGSLPRPWNALKVTAAWAVGTVLAVGAFALGTYLRSGRLPDWGMATAYQRIFALNGFAMLPMPPFGLHWVVYLTFMAVIAVGLFDRTAPTAQRGLSLYAGVFGSGAMMYYVGRSHPSVLITVFPAWGFALLLLVWSCWSRLAPRLRTEGWRALTPGAVLLALGYAAVAGRFSERPNLSAQYRRLTRRYWDDAGAQMLLGNYFALTESLRAHAAPGEKVAVIAPYGHLAAGEVGVVNVFPFSSPISVLVRPQLAAVSRALCAGEVRRVFTDQACLDMEQELVRLGYRRPDSADPYYWVLEDGGAARASHSSEP